MHNKHVQARSGGETVCRNGKQATKPPPLGALAARCVVSRVCVCFSLLLLFPLFPPDAPSAPVEALVHQQRAHCVSQGTRTTTHHSPQEESTASSNDFCDLPLPNVHAVVVRVGFSFAPLCGNLAAVQAADLIRYPLASVGTHSAAQRFSHFYGDPYKYEEKRVYTC